MNQRITLLTASTLWLFGVLAPVAYAGKPVEHPNKLYTQTNIQAEAMASEHASFNRNTGTALAANTNVQAQSTAMQINTNTTSVNDPTGNNGTVKIDGQPYDTHPDNQPHVGCSFQVDFYNFDAGEHYANVVFSAQSPSGSNHQILVDRVFIGQDSAEGGTDIDAQPTYNLSGLLSQLTPHPQQGYHIKLTVHADGSQGADTKHKVFWVKCGQPIGGQGGPLDIQPVAKQTPATVFSSLLPRTGGVLAAILLPLVGGILGATYAYLRQKYLTQA